MHRLMRWVSHSFDRVLPSATADPDLAGYRDRLNVAIARWSVSLSGLEPVYGLGVAVLAVNLAVIAIVAGAAGYIRQPQYWVPLVPFFVGELWCLYAVGFRVFVKDAPRQYDFGPDLLQANEGMDLVGRLQAAAKDNELLVTQLRRAVLSGVSIPLLGALCSALEFETQRGVLTSDTPRVFRLVWALFWLLLWVVPLRFGFVALGQAASVAEAAEIRARRGRRPVVLRWLLNAIVPVQLERQLGLHRRRYESDRQLE